ncbi:Leptomycin B resistance protein pmd1-like protein 7 [Phlyctema vagabunda]|uniref:Leptomycin B resistance protein pmd1-like protein 7 n=1 Tax=Phlyctema vagabunda TaxID=108571 RepID=A0ABR4P7J9_9HELO
MATQGVGESEMKHPYAEKPESETTEVQDDHDGSMKDYRRVFAFADKIDVILDSVALAACIGSGAALPLMTLVFGGFVTKVNDFAVGTITPSDFRGEIRKFTLYFVYLFIGKFVLTYIFTVCISIAATRTTKALRAAFFEKTLRQDIAFFESSSTGAVATQVTTNGNLIQQGIAEKLGLTVQAIATFVASFVIAFTVQWKLTLITLCIVPVIIIVTSIGAWIDAAQEGRILHLYSLAGMLAEEVFSSIRTVQAFWAHPRLSKEFDEHLAAAEKEGMRKSLNLAILYSTEFFCVYCGYALAFWQGVRMYSRGEIQQSGDVITVLFAVVMASTSMTQIAPHMMAFTKAGSAASALFRTMDRISAIDPLGKDGLHPDSITGNLELRDLHFAYPSRPTFPVLDGLSLSIPANKTTALLGASGCGKSTVIGLIERWYQLSDGSIFLDGNDITELNVGWLRTNIRLVQQEPVLFVGTVFENVTNGLMGLASAESSEEEKMKLVEDACKLANAHDFITQLPQGYHTQVGERAGMLSGGQKQRVAIARSIISNPKILLLDEATSALDSRAEKVVQEALDKVSKTRTTLVISHKLKTVQNADNIVLIANGKVVEQGTHDELLAAGGRYSSMVAAQDLGNDESNVESDSASSTESTFEIAKTRSVAKSEFVQTAGAEDRAEDSPGTLNYGIVKCLVILLWEQKNLWPWFLGTAVVALPAGFTFFAQALLFAREATVFQLEGKELIRKGDFYSLMFFVIALANLFSYFGIGWASNVIAQVSTRRYRFEMFNNILHQDMEFFDRPENTAGALVSRLSTQPTSLQELLCMNLTLIYITVVNLLASCILALVVGPKLGAVVVFGALPPLLAAGIIRIRLEQTLDNQSSKRFAASAGLAGEAVSAIRTVSSLALESNILKRYHAELDTIVGNSIKQIFWTMFWFSLTQSIDFLSMGLGFWYGGKLLSTGEYSTNQFFVVFVAVIFGGQAAAQFFAYSTSITKGISAANYILWLRSLQPRIREDESNEDKGPEGDGKVELRDLEFSYPQRPDSKVLKGINLKFNPGQFVAFVGSSGCGKSTLISLLERFYDPTSGRITISDQSISTYSPKKYREHISLVQQEPVLYQGSIAYNISLGLPHNNPTTEQIETACRQANILTFIHSLPQGLETPCGARGLSMSGGQRQRIAIARALIRNPRLLLLDEATSALDTESERIVQAALEEVVGKSTTVAVAHRLSTIKNADIIFVFEGGRVVEAGGHKELLAKKGVYFSMCMVQSLDQN